MGISETAGITLRPGTDFLTRMYDISTNNKDAAQTTDLLQPSILAQGVSYPGDRYMSASPSLTGLASHTVILWINHVPALLERNPIGLGASNNQILVSQNSLNLRYYCYDANSPISIPITLTSGAWQMVAIVSLSGTGSKIMKFPDYKEYVSPNQNTYTYVSNIAVIGARANTGNIYQGKIGSILLYSGALSQDAIAGIYDKTKWMYV